jgi:hypothetical protein
MDADISLLRPRTMINFLVLCNLSKVKPATTNLCRGPAITGMAETGLSSLPDQPAATVTENEKRMMRMNTHRTSQQKSMQKN